MENTDSSPATGAAAGSAPAGADAALPVKFSGTPGGYWKVHMAGLALTLMSLGLYAPWAKLRRHRYLLAHSHTLGSSFEFDASPWSILVSRLIVVAIILLAAWADNAYPFIDGEAVGLGTVVILAVLPAAIMRGRAFHARHTLFKGVRFCYAPCYLHLYAYYALLLSPFIVILAMIAQNPGMLNQEPADDQQLVPLVATLLIWTIAMPAFSHFEHRILANNLHFGKLALAAECPLRTYYAMAARKLLAAVLLAVVCGLLVAATAGGEMVVLAFPMLGFLAGMWAVVMFRLDAVRLFWGSLRLSDGSRIASGITFRGLLRVFTINSLLTIASLGVLWPMARARKWQYIAGSIGIVPGSQLAAVEAADRQEAIAALGEEGAGFAGFDFDAGVI